MLQSWRAQTGFTNPNRNRYRKVFLVGYGWEPLQAERKIPQSPEHESHVEDKAFEWAAAHVVTASPCEETEAELPDCSTCSVSDDLSMAN